MTPQEIGIELTSIGTLLVDKIGRQPKMGGLSMYIMDSGNCTIGIYAETYDRIHTAGGNTFEDCLADARAFVEAMPDHEKHAKTEWHKSLGKVIDEGHALNLPDDVLTPLRTSSKAMHKNLLAAPSA